MKYSKYSGSGKGLGERGKRIKKAPITGLELEALRLKNQLAESLFCISCGIEIEHNYGTENYPQCIICGNENVDDYFNL